MKNPFFYIHPSKYKTAFWLYLILTLIITYILQRIGSELIIKNDIPFGIVDFELAGTMEKAEQIMGLWKEKGVTNVAFFVQGIDYLYLWVYSHTIGLACILSSRLKGKTLLKIGLILASLQIVAAFFDAIENTALTYLLFGYQSECLPLLAKWTAIPKFLFIILGILFSIICIFLPKNELK